MRDPLYTQGTLLNDNFSLQEKDALQKDESRGNRVSISQIELLSNFYRLYNASPNEVEFRSNLKEQEPVSKGAIMENLRWSIYGTQIHQLQYFRQLFERSAYFKRIPSLNDFKYTFPYREDDYYDASLRLLDLTDLKSSNLAQEYWNEWRMNGQDFTPKKNSGYLIDPTIVRSMWEYGTIPLRDIDEFNSNGKYTNLDKLNPEKTILINEVPMITNIFFNDTNLQVPAMIDEIWIPKDFPHKPIHIVDYKTGKQFKQPEYKEKVQIFLMMTAVLTNILDKAYTMQFSPTKWDVLHDKREFPSFTKRNLKNTLRGGINADDLIHSMEVFNDKLTFSYINPLTQDCIDVNTSDIGTNSMKGIKDMVMYLYTLNTFYTKHKDILKPRMTRNASPFTLPSFPIKDFSQSSGFSKNVQLGLV